MSRIKLFKAPGVILLALLIACLPGRAVFSATPALAEITAQLGKNRLTQGRFQQQKQLRFLSKPLQSSGRFTYHPTKGVYWQTDTPLASVMLINDTQLLTDAGSQTVPAAFGRIFNALLGGDFTKLAETFVITEIPQAGGWQLRFIPQDPLLRKAIQQIDLSGNNEIRRVVIQESNDSTTRIDFIDLTHPDHLTPEQEAAFARLSS